MKMGMSGAYVRSAYEIGRRNNMDTTDVRVFNVKDGGIFQALGMMQQLKEVSANLAASNATSGKIKVYSPILDRELLVEYDLYKKRQRVHNFSHDIKAPTDGYIFRASFWGYLQVEV